MDKNIRNEPCLFDNDVLFHILFDIKEKYNIRKPKFMIDRVLIDDPYVIDDWADFQTGSDWWIKYKHIKDDVFELKAYFPNPPADICSKLIDDVFEDVNKKHENIHYKIAGIIYNEKQARKAMMYYLMIGYENIWYDKPKLDNKKRYTCKINFFPEMETYWSLDKGYLTLEEK